MKLNNPDTLPVQKSCVCEPQSGEYVPDQLRSEPEGSGGALGYFLGGYVPPGTPNWNPVLKKISPKIDTPF